MRHPPPVPESVIDVERIHVATFQSNTGSLGYSRRTDPTTRIPLPVRNPMFRRPKRMFKLACWTADPGLVHTAAFLA